jgi:hypothetical protein
MQRGVDVRLGTRVAAVDSAGVRLVDGTTLASETVVCTIGTRPNPLVERIGVALARGRIVTDARPVDSRAQRRVAIGDCARIANGAAAADAPGRTAAAALAPPTAQFAVAEANALALNLAAHLAGRPTQPFRYVSKGAMATTGHLKGVAVLFGCARLGAAGVAALARVLPAADADASAARSGSGSSGRGRCSSPPTSPTCASSAATKPTLRAATIAAAGDGAEREPDHHALNPGESTMLKQKSAIVTGSTSGIGLGIARAFAESGADVMLNGFGNADEIEFTRAELQRTCDVRVRYSSADMSKPEQIRAMAEQAAREFGKVDIVVNNAGIQHVAPDRGISRREVGRDRRHQPVVGVPPRQGSGAGE